MGAGTAPICLQGRLFTWWGLHTKCRFVLDWLVSTPKQLCVLLWVSCTGLPRLGRFGPSVGPSHPPPKPPFDVFDLWSKQYRVDHARPRPAQALRNVLVLKMRDLKPPF